MEGKRNPHSNLPVLPYEKNRLQMPKLLISLPPIITADQATRLRWAGLKLGAHKGYPVQAENCIHPPSCSTWPSTTHISQWQGQWMVRPRCSTLSSHSPTQCSMRKEGGREGRKKQHQHDELNQHCKSKGTWNAASAAAS